MGPVAGRSEPDLAAVRAGARRATPSLAPHPATTLSKPAPAVFTPIRSVATWRRRHVRRWNARAPPPPAGTTARPAGTACAAPRAPCSRARGSRTAALRSAERKSKRFPDVKLFLRHARAVDVTGLMSGSRTAYLLEMVRQCLLRELTQMAAAAPGGLGWTHGAVQVQARRCPGGCDPAAAGVAVELGLGHAWWSTGAGARRFLMHRLTRSPPDRRARSSGRARGHAVHRTGDQAGSRSLAPRPCR